MIVKFLNNLEHKDHPLLGPNVRLLTTFGLLQPKPGLATYMANLIHFSNFICLITQIIELWYIKADLDHVMKNLSVSTITAYCVAKAMSFVYWQKRWKGLIESVSQLEKRQLLKSNDSINKFIKDYTNYSRKITYGFFFLVFLTSSSLVLKPLLTYLSTPEMKLNIKNGTVPYPEIMSTWLPFEKSRGRGYFFMIFWQIIMVYLGGGAITAVYDVNVFALMVFFAGQFKILKHKCEKIFGDNKDASEKDVLKNIEDCHFHHLFLVKQAKILDSLLSPVMFIYFIICSLMFCAFAILITSEEMSVSQQLSTAEMLMALVIQLFLFCWNSGEVTLMSETISYGTYCSRWYLRSVRERRSMLLLTGQLRKRVQFRAGPFAYLNITNFIAILKMSYSYYALLRNK